jgi:hypothetical protein
MSDDVSDYTPPAQAQNISPALGLAILGGCAIGVFILLKQLPAHHLTKSDVQRLLFYKYLREKGKLES